MSTETAGRFRRALARLGSSTEQLDAEELQEACVCSGAVPVAQLDLRSRATVAGTVRSVTLRPRAGVPALVADLYDGSGVVALVWLGRREIPGIEPGRTLSATGTIADDDGRLVMFNPRYELKAAGGGE